MLVWVQQTNPWKIPFLVTHFNVLAHICKCGNATRCAFNVHLSFSGDWDWTYFMLPVCAAIFMLFLSFLDQATDLKASHPGTNIYARKYVSLWYRVRGYDV